MPTPIPFGTVSVQIIGVTTQPGQLTARLRLYNDGPAPVPVTADTVWIAFGYAENPPGPRLPAEGLAPFDLLSGQAADLTLVWPWAGEPFAAFGLGAWRFTAELRG